MSSTCKNMQRVKYKRFAQKCAETFCSTKISLKGNTVKNFVFCVGIMILGDFDEGATDNHVKYFFVKSEN